MLLAVMFLLFLLMLSLAVAAPRMARAIQRDHDEETMQRGKQYRRAVQLYYRKFHAYPPSADALVKTSEIRFLRKKYVDPVTGKDDWKPIMFGQNKVPIAMGFFGQPLSMGSSLAGIGPSGGNGINGLGNGMNGGLNGGINGGSSNALFNSPSSTSNSSTTGGTNDTSGTSGQTGNGSSSSTTATGTTTATGGADSGSSSNNGGVSGQTFGGAGIIGFEPGSSKQSILIFKKKDHYNEWEFTYDPTMDMRTVSGGNTGAIGQPASGMSSPIGNTGTTTNGIGGGTNTTTTQPSTPSSSPQQ
jgi:hypothetical protein